MANGSNPLHVAAIGLACIAGSTAFAGQIDAGSYVLGYDDTLGIPELSMSGGLRIYTFPSFRRGNALGDRGVSLSDSFSATVTAAQGHRLTVRPDESFPVWAEMRISDFVAYPDEQPPPDPGEYPEYFSGSYGEANSAGTVNVSSGAVIISNSVRAGIDMHHPLVVESENYAIPGSWASRADVTLTDSVQGLGAIRNVWYCPWWKDDCEWIGFFPPSEVFVEAWFTPVIVVDESFVGVVPEPSTLALLGAGFLALTLRRRTASTLR